MDPNISKSTTDKERVVTVCAESQSTWRGPNRTRFFDVGWRTWRQCCGSVWRSQCWYIYQYILRQINIFYASPHPLSVSPIYTQTHRYEVRICHWPFCNTVQDRVLRETPHYGLKTSGTLWNSSLWCWSPDLSLCQGLRYCDGMKGDTVTLTSL